MTALITRLAVLLANYEMDEPHYPQAVNEQYEASDLQAWRARLHDGDCIRQPGPCLRCMADEWVHKANWIADRLDSK